MKTLLFQAWSPPNRLRADRWLRMFMWLAIANALHILAIVALLKVAKVPQALDALLALSDHKGTLWSDQLIIPGIVAIVLVGTSSVLLGFGLRKCIAHLAAPAISPGTIDLVCVVVFPFLIALGISWAAVSWTQYINCSGVSRFALLAIFSVVSILQLLVHLRVVLRMRRTAPGLQPERTLLPLVIALCAALLIALVGVVVAVSGINRPTAIGPMGLVLMAAGFWSAALTFLLITIPLFINWIPASAVWLMLLIGFSFRMDNPYRTPVNAPMLDGAALEHARYENADEALYKWIKSRLPANDAGGPIPVVLVSADGGGIRAAYFAARSLAILDRETNGAFSRNTFAYSGVSGGSLGVATFIDSAKRNPGKPEVVLDEIDRFYARDLLSPVLARMLVVDPLRYMTNSPGIKGRDQIFEDFLDSQWRSVADSSFFSESMLDALGLKSQQDMAPPIVIFSSTIADTGARLEISNIKASAQRTRAHSYFGYHREVNVRSLSVAQAVHLSARFPGFSPPGSIHASRCESASRDRQEGPCRWVDFHWITAVDGGYHDNSGVAPLILMLDFLAGMRDRGANPNASQVAPEPVASFTPAQLRRREQEALLARVSFHVVVLIANPDYEKDDQEGVVRFNLDPFQEPLAAGEPMSDFGAAVAAFNKTRQGREPESWLLLDMFMGRLPRPVDGKRLADDRMLYSVDQSLDPNIRDSAVVSAACAGIGEANLTIHLVDIPLGWSLSAAARRTMKCVTERAAHQRIRRLLPLQRHWKLTEPKPQ